MNHNGQSDDMSIFNDIFRFLDDTVDKVNDYSSNFPPADIYADGEDLLVFEFAVAGYDPKDINIVFEGNSLKVTRDAPPESKKCENHYFKQKIAKRNFEVKYTLAIGKFDTAKSTASFKDGILKIEIPRDKDSKPRNVNIDIG